MRRIVFPPNNHVFTRHEGHEPRQTALSTGTGLHSKTTVRCSMLLHAMALPGRSSSNRTPRERRGRSPARAAWASAADSRGRGIRASWRNSPPKPESTPGSAMKKSALCHLIAAATRWEAAGLAVRRPRVPSTHREREYSLCVQKSTPCWSKQE